MDIRSTSDANIKTGTADVVYEFNDAMTGYFSDRHYGGDLQSIFVVLMCRNPEIEFRRRIRMSKKESTLYMDVMLDVPLMIRSTHAERKLIVAKKLAEEVPEVLGRYSIKGFDYAGFVRDFVGRVKTWGHSRAAEP